MKRKARLRGDNFDLQALATIFSEGDPRVSVDSEGNYNLESSVFDLLADAVDVKPGADRLLTTINGAAKAQDPSYRFAQLAGHFENEEGLHAVVTADTISVRSRVNAVIVSTDGTPVAPPPSPARAWRSLAETNTNVADALRLLGSVDLDWVALYKLVEIVKDDVGGSKVIVMEGWATEQQLSAFGAAANRPDVSGDDARHARMAGGPPKHAMTIGEGRHFAHGLVRSWLQWRVQKP